MATYNTYPDGRPILKAGGGNAAGFPMVTVLEGLFDAYKRNLVAADIVQLIQIPKGTLVHAVGYEIITADAGQTIHLGDEATAAGYFSAANVATQGAKAVTSLVLATGTPNTVVGYSGGKFYATAATLDLTVPSTMALDTLKIRVFAIASILGMST
jgi:hypothetical protein